MHDYRGCISSDFTKQIRKIALQYPFISRQDVRVECLGKILRNSQRIFQFVTVSLEEDIDDILRIRNLPEDGVFFCFIHDLSTTKECPIFDEDDDDDENWSDDTDDDAYDYNSSDAREKGSEEEDKDDDRVHGESDSNTATYSSPEEEKPTTLVIRLKELLNSSLYQERHITILTENRSDKVRIEEILRSMEHPIQDTISFHVKHIVVDTLETFEGLESPVILFVVPESWGTGYLGSLKYRLCIATRAISRLEFLVPWHPEGRQNDLVELSRAFQTEVNKITPQPTPRSILLPPPPPYFSLQL